MLPTIGSKELVAWLPTLLGLAAGDVVVIPSVCYPTYEVGARLAGATVIRSDQPATLGSDSGARLVWINSPGNPNGAVLSADEMRATIAWARANDVVVASDECYLTLGWETQPDIRAGRLRWRLHRRDRGAFVVETLEPGRLSGRVRRR